MQPAKLLKVSALLGILCLGLVFGWTWAGYSQEVRIPEGVYIKITKEFYDALRGEGNEGVKVYSNDASNEYLRQIAVSGRFMVETNLQILKNQEQMIKLLQSIRDQKAKIK